jgi:hypothetical protein
MRVQTAEARHSLLCEVISTETGVARVALSARMLCEPNRYSEKPFVSSPDDNSG